MLSVRPELSQTQQLEPRRPKGGSACPASPCPAQHSLSPSSLCTLSAAQRTKSFSFLMFPSWTENSSHRNQATSGSRQAPKRNREPSSMSKGGAMGNTSLALVNSAKGSCTHHPVHSTHPQQWRPEKGCKEQHARLLVADSPGGFPEPETAAVVLPNRH